MTHATLSLLRWLVSHDSFKTVLVHSFHTIVQTGGTSRYTNSRYGSSFCLPSSVAALRSMVFRVLLKRSTSPSVCGLYRFYVK